LVQLPGLLLLVVIVAVVANRFDVPLWLAVLIIFAWIAKDIVLYLFVWQAYDPDAGRDRLIGTCGVARQPLSPAGYVLVRGELWRAEVMEGESPVRKGERVRVCAVRGLTLLVVGIEADSDQSGL
jgi:membrane protein implicated in regulation of membrane protease activity